MTNILAIPLVQITATVGSDEDWIDAISFTDSNNVPIDLTGITITLDISTGVTTTLTASTANGFLSFVEAAGSSVNNVLLINVPAASKTALTGNYVLSGIASADGHLIDIITGSLTIRQSY